MWKNNIAALFRLRIFRTKPLGWEEILPPSCSERVAVCLCWLNLNDAANVPAHKNEGHLLHPEQNIIQGFKHSILHFSNTDSRKAFQVKRTWQQRDYSGSTTGTWRAFSSATERPPAQEESRRMMRTKHHVRGRFQHVPLTEAKQNSSWHLAGQADLVTAKLQRTECNNNTR